MGDLFTFNRPVGRPPTWIGRTVMLNVAVQSRYQSKGFVLTSANPIVCVPPDALDAAVQIAVDRGILIDVTDAGVKGFKLKDSELLPMKTEVETKTTVFTGKDAAGNTYIITPKDEEDLQRMLEEIKTTGGLRLHGQQASGASMSFTAEPLVEKESS